MKKLALLTTFFATASTLAMAQDAAAPSREGGFGLGREALPEEVAAWDIDIRPDGLGLPEGSGNVWDGEGLFIDHCSACHGDFGEAVGRWPVLAGGFGTLDGEDPVKTVGSYWPYLSTVWDYIHRAMPYGAAQSLSDDDVYALTAYLMFVNDLVEDDFELSNENFLEVPLPNEDAFFMDDRAAEEYPLFSQEPCMTACAETIEVTATAMILNVTPEEDAEGEAHDAAVEAEAEGAGDAATEPEDTGPDPELVAMGEGLFRQCSTCHEIGPDAGNRTGPALVNVYGQPAASRDGFRYSPAFTEAAEGGLVWNDETLAAFLSDPRGYIRGNRMGFRGLRDDAEIAAMIAYIRAAGGE